LCGEYGERNHRPHYHAALFGAGTEDEKIIRDAWGLGFVFVGTLTQDSAQYIAGYVTKKLTNPEDERTKEKLNGRHPEFARMSNRPGIGATAMEDVAAAIQNESLGGLHFIQETRDVPTHLNSGKTKIFLGRYLKNKLRKKVGNLEVMKLEAAEKLTEEMLALRKTAREDVKNKKKTWRQIIKEKNEKKVIEFEQRFSIKNQRSRNL